MVAAAVEALPGTRITAVTVLTSLDADSLAAIGLAGPPEAAAVRLARLAVDAGARAIVCSPQEVAAIRAAVPPDITLITPGVRPAGAALDDQRRVATPARAIADGADLLVDRAARSPGPLTCVRPRRRSRPRSPEPSRERAGPVGRPARGRPGGGPGRAAGAIPPAQWP